jgi:archaellum biogenesis ATPase FlaH
MLNTALQYYKSGLCILPLTGNKKNPSLTSWDEYKTNRPSLDQTREWFSTPDITGIVMVCGKVSGVTVVDDDSYKTGNPLTLHSPLESKTASGGRHIFFKYSPNVKNQNVRTSDQEFEIQNDGKLIVLPPSKAMNKSGVIGQYEWLVKDQGIIHLLPELGDDFTAQYKITDHHGVDMSELFSVSLGQQHNYLRTLINKLLFQTPEEAWENQVKPIVLSAAEKYNPPHPPERVEKLWNDCVYFVSGKKQQQHQPLGLSKISIERQAERELERNSPSTGFEGLDKLIKGFVPGRLYILTGDTNVGKTSIAANFTIALAEKNHKVLYFALEPANTVIDYLDTVAYNITFDQIEHDYQNENIKIYTRDQVETLEQMVGVVKKLPRQDLIVVDHIGYFVSPKNGNVYQAQSDTMKILVQLAKKKNSAIILIAHTRKGLKDGIPKIDDISGSGSFKQDATDVLIVVKDQDEDSKYGNEYLNKGAIIVAKTKSGSNGYIPITFKERSAKIHEQNTFKPAF